jgi:phosphoglycolate phosphatase-like HAD superfamily hydrolase
MYYENNSKYYFSLRGNDDTIGLLEKAGETTLRIFSEYLDTEEHAMQFLERVRKGYSDVFTQFLAFINRENEKLHDTIEDLSKRLLDSSVVENKEDGTVEIHLGGKVFRGNIVEK